jgi:hypothetical protein
MPNKLVLALAHMPFAQPNIACRPWLSANLIFSLRKIYPLQAMARRQTMTPGTKAHMFWGQKKRTSPLMGRPLEKVSGNDILSQV